MHIYGVWIEGEFIPWMGGGKGGGSTTVVNTLPAKTPTELLLEKQQLQSLERQQAGFAQAAAFQDPVSAQAYLNTPPASRNINSPFAGLEQFDSPTFRTSLQGAQARLDAQNRFQTSSMEASQALVDQIRAAQGQQQTWQQGQDAWQRQQATQFGLSQQQQANQFELGRQQQMSQFELSRQQQAQQFALSQQEAAALRQQQAEQFGLSQQQLERHWATQAQAEDARTQFWQNQFTKQAGAQQAWQDQQTKQAIEARLAYKQQIQGAQDLYNRQLSNAQGITALTPADQALIDQMYGGAQARGEQDLRRFLGETANMRGLNISDSPVVSEGARQAALLGLGIQSAKAAASADLVQRTKQQLINQAQFNAGMAQNQAQFELGAAQQGGQFGLGTAQQAAQFSTGMGFQQAQAGVNMGQFNQQLEAGLSQFAQSLQQQAFSNRMALASYQQPTMAPFYQGEVGQRLAQSTQQSAYSVPGWQAFNQTAGSTGGFGLGAAAAWKAFSDRRLKSQITRVGTHPIGVGLYEYTIAGRRERGVMADEVLRVKPDAVIMDSQGYLMVNYGKLI